MALLNGLGTFFHDKTFLLTFPWQFPDC